MAIIDETTEAAAQDGEDFNKKVEKIKDHNG